jgi:hypothetical protein
MFHQSAHNEAGHLALPIVEDTHSLQLAIIRILHSLADDSIDARKASAMLYGLQLAGMNIKQFCRERRNVEDPEGTIAHRAFATFLSRKMKLPVPSAKEVDKLLMEVAYDMPVELDSPIPSNRPRVTAAVAAGPPEADAAS